MRREKKLRLVVTFHTTAAALKTERTAKDAGLEGRLIPVPRELSAGCGLAWSAPPETGPRLLALLREKNVECAETCELLL